MSTLAVNQITTQTGDTITLPTGKKIVGTDAGSIAAPGHIIQVQSAAKRDTFAHATSTFTDIGLTITITPEQSNSHIMIVASVAGGSQTSSATTLRLLRDGTVILPDNPTSPGNRQVGMYDMYTAGNQYNVNSYSFTFVDTGRTAGTSAITYKFQVKTHQSGPVYINRSGNDSNVSNYVRSTSHIQLLEIAQ